MNIILLVIVIYLIILIVSLVYAGMIVYHVLTYDREGFSPDYIQLAQRNLALFLIVAGVVLVSSIVGAIIFSFVIK